MSSPPETTSNSKKRQRSTGLRKGSSAASATPTASTTSNAVEPLKKKPFQKNAKTWSITLPQCNVSREEALDRIVKHLGENLEYACVAQGDELCLLFSKLSL